MLDDSGLERSSVVANNAMNRERGLDGVNSYTRELGFHPLKTLAPGQAWLDLCCGSGRALIEASPGGLFAGHLDPANVKTPKPFRPGRFGMDYDARRHLVKIRGPRRLNFPYRYLGADPNAGPNFTGQPAVDSLYRSIDN